jgi:hypothetical protein
MKAIPKGAIRIVCKSEGILELWGKENDDEEYLLRNIIFQPVLNK